MTTGALSVPTLSRVLFFILLALSCTPLVSPPVALGLGILLALTLGPPFPAAGARWTKILLQACVVGLGFGMSLETIIEAGKNGVLLTIGTLAGTLVLGTVLGRVLRVEGTTAWLISGGTAICGGSAIAAVGPVIGADARQMSVALGTVFVLNAVALFIFPPIGHALHLSQTEFGLWSAIAIHDTSSVVGAAARYGSGALETATTVKLARALWLIPLALVTSRLHGRGAKKKNEEPKKGTRKKIAIPWFIFLFLLAVIVRTAVGDAAGVPDGIAAAARQGMVAALFLIGAGLSRDVLKGVGARPFLLGVLLWVIVAGVTLGLITAWSS